ncbi:MAG: hypothetical protein MJA29_14155, partial [Candidatus Omnitrophica bacterium]|nr:hypothetical protein [Candidatus Omnitrophota bacterium]
FKRSSEAVKFYVSGLDFPIVVHGMEKEYPRQEFERIFQGWNPPEDDVRKPTPKGPFILMIEGSAKLNRNGNPWHNLVGARREGQASAATPPEDVPF